MTNDKNRVQDILNRALTRYGGLPQRQVDAAMDRAWEALRPAASRGMTWTVAQSPAPRRLPLRLAAAAAAALVVAAAGTAIVWRSADDALFRVVQGDVQQQGEAIRSRDASGAVLALTDGSGVEMRSQSELSLERADDGVRIRLNTGSIIVNAAKQREGHLYVQTKDVMVSVVGTVFLVNAEEQGSRVAVLEGEVRVLRGTSEQKLLPGQQLVTSPLMMAPPLPEDVAWSRNAESHVALLQQASVAAPVRTPENVSEPRVAFEEVSIRWRQGIGGGAGARGAGDGGSTGGPCESVAPVQLDPRRLAVTRAGLLCSSRLRMVSAHAVMGRGVGHYSAPHKFKLGWLPTQVRTITSSGSYSVQPTELAGTIKALKIRRGTDNANWLWVEYRQALDIYDAKLASFVFNPTNPLVYLDEIDSHIYSGGLIHYEDATTGNTSQLLDFTPGSREGATRVPVDWLDPPLVGSWQDAHTGLSITTSSPTSSGLRVDIAYGLGACVESNPSVAISPANPSAKRGQLVTYTVTVTNNDSPECYEKEFNLASSLPAGWPTVFSQATAVVPAASSVSVSMTKTVPANGAFATFPVDASATSGSYSATGSASVTVKPGK
jgi:hypothetical protein